MIDITSGGAPGYNRDLFFFRDSTNRFWVTWVSSERSIGTLQWRIVEGDNLGPVQTIRTMGGAPASPRLIVCREDQVLLLWLEYREGRGTLYSLPIGDHAQDNSVPERVFPAELNVGSFSCDSDREGNAWLAAEIWGQGSVGIRLAQLQQRDWQDRGVVSPKAGFRTRPCVRAGAAAGMPGFLLSWDEYENGHYRVATMFLDKGPTRVSCAGIDSAWNTLSTASPSLDGDWYLAWSQDELVSLPGNVLNHHSQIKVARLSRDSDIWQEVGAVDIDYALNPWMAAYVGLRRFPNLVPCTDGGVWLLWEVKQDPKAMEPGPGQLLAQRLPAASDAKRSELLIDNRSCFVVESSPYPRSQLAVASKTQLRTREQRLPFLLNRVDLQGSHPQVKRPTFSRPRWNPQPHNARATVQPEGYQLFFGDPHIHTRMSGDLDGEPDEAYHFAKDVAHLDFAAVTENDYTWFTEPLSADAWERIRRYAAFFDEPGAFTAFLGWEYTKHVEPDSHRCVILPGDAGQIFSWHDDTPTPQCLVKKLKGTEALLHHHHDFGFDISDDSLERNIEICSGWTNWMIRPEFRARLHKLLDKGFKVGFIGGSDNHERNPGLGGPLTGVWAEANTRHDIYEAFKQRCVFATTGLRPVLEFRVNGVLMGGTAETRSVPRVSIRVECDRNIDFVEIIRDGTMIHRVLCDQPRLVLEWDDQDCVPGPHYYYCHVQFEGEEADLYWNISPVFGIHAWSSPVWLMKED